jgi:uncharacterized protein YbaR (Trm112 family)
MPEDSRDVHPDLLKQLTCICEERSALTEDPKGLRCVHCDRIFPLVEGIPHILPDSESES